MAIYHLSAKIVRRSTGQSVVAAAAYRSGENIHDERSGRNHDYTRKGGVLHTEIVIPSNTPVWMHDRAQLWNAVEKIERRRDAQLAREVEVALPRELTAEANIEMVRTFVTAEFVSQGMIADFAIHNGRARDGGEQPHAHILLTTRELTGSGFGGKNRDWNAGDLLDGWREQWAELVNAELARAGHDERVDHRSLEVQRAEAEGKAQRARSVGNIQEAEVQEVRAATLDREPEPKLGPSANQMEKLGHASRRGDERREREARNAERRALYEQARRLAKQIADVARQVAEHTRHRLQELVQRLEMAYHTRRLREKDDLPHPTPLSDPNSQAPRAGDVITTSMRDLLLGRVTRTAENASQAVGREKEAARNVPSVQDMGTLLGRGVSKVRDAASHDDEDRGR